MNLNLAIGELHRSMDQHAHNAPLHDLMEDEAQAHLCRKVAEQCRQAIQILQIDTSCEYVQKVSDQCDRIVWRDQYIHLPIRT